jgi:hypothetical protein
MAMLRIGGRERFNRDCTNTANRQDHFRRRLHNEIPPWTEVVSFSTLKKRRQVAFVPQQTVAAGTGGHFQYFDFGGSPHSHLPVCQL